MPHERQHAAKLNPYLQWRREGSIGRWIKGGVAGIVDVDAYEHCAGCYAPLAFHELVEGHRSGKCWPAIRELAGGLAVQGCLLGYEIDPDAPPLNRYGRPDPQLVDPISTPDLRRIHVTGLGTGLDGWWSPLDWAQELDRLKKACECKTTRQAA